MPFKKVLSELVDRVPGGLGAILVDWEGEAVDQFGAMDAYELKVVGAHKGVILHHLRDMLRRLGGEENLQEVVVTTRRLQTLILPVTDDYFLVFAVERGDLLGRALFESRRCVVELRKEIA